MPKNRPDKVEYEKRLLTVQGWMIDGAPTCMIIQHILLKLWAKSDRHALMIIAKARERWLSNENESREDKRKLKVLSLQNRIRGMNNDFKNTPAGVRTILMVEKEINKLEGLYFIPVKEKTEITPIEVNNLINISNTNKSDIDYTKLSDEVLEAIVAAKK